MRNKYKRENGKYSKSRIGRHEAGIVNRKGANNVVPGALLCAREDTVMHKCQGLTTRTLLGTPGVKTTHVKFRNTEKTENKWSNKNKQSKDEPKIERTQKIRANGNFRTIQ